MSEKQISHINKEYGLELRTCVFRNILVSGGRLPKASRRAKIIYMRILRMHIG